MRGAIARAATPAGLALAFAVQLGLLLSLAGRAPGAALVFVLAGVTLVVALASAGRVASRIAGMGRRDLLLSALAGSLTVFAAPYLVVTHRFSDAPPGTETIFFAGVGWGVVAILVGAGALWRRGRRSAAVGAIAGAMAVATGGAGSLGNWERPSSFSPLVRFPVEEAWMLAGGAAFVLGGLILMHLGRTHGRRLPLLVGSAAALVASGIALAASNEGFAGLSALGNQVQSVSLWATAWAVTVMLWTDVLSFEGPVRAGACLVAVPVLYPVMSALERAVGVSGPNPLVWPGVIGGSLIVVAGVARLVRAGDARAIARPVPLVGRWYALGVVAVAVAALFLPAMRAAVSADRADGVLSWAWTLPGWEVVAGWIAVSCALLLVAVVFDDKWWPAFAALGAVAALPLLESTPMHVLTGWLSPDVQQDFGTEYASITFRAMPSLSVRAAVVGAGVGLVVVSVRHLAQVIRTRSGAGHVGTEE